MRRHRGVIERLFYVLVISHPGARAGGLLSSVGDKVANLPRLNDGEAAGCGCRSEGGAETRGAQSESAVKSVSDVIADHDGVEEVPAACVEQFRRGQCGRDNRAARM